MDNRSAQQIALLGFALCTFFMINVVLHAMICG